jgi:5'-methylthioadenosine phosphorylase
VPYRANLWALRSLGVRQVLAPCAVGGLQVELGPGTFVVPDQLVDRTTKRIQTYYDENACHVAFADPFCGRLRAHLQDGLADFEPVDGGTLVVIDGPRFSTRAESTWYASHGWSVIGMTTHPEAILARELALCYATVCLVTDHDAGVDEASAVSHEEVLRVFGEHIGVLKSGLTQVIASIGADRDCSCSQALDGLDLPIRLP